MNAVYSWQVGPKRYQLMDDDDYRSEGAWALATEEETAAAVAEEQAKLNSGEWIAVGCIVTEPCPAPEHCPCCAQTHETDSLWGIVIENSVEAWEEQIPALMGHDAQ